MFRCYVYRPHGSHAFMIVCALILLFLAVRLITVSHDFWQEITEEDIIF